MIEMDRIAEAVARIVQEFSPQQIVLFGSYAYGTPTEDSDVDLLIILPFAGNHIHPAFTLNNARKSISKRVCKKRAYPSAEPMTWSHYLIRSYR